MSKSSSKNVQKVAAAIAKECFAERVRYLNRSLTSIYDDAFRPLGITASQVILLVTLIERGTLSAGQLGRLLNVEKSTLSRNLERMRKAGWIEITAPTSGRTHAIEASRKGKKLLLEVFPRWREAQNATALLLGTDGSKALRKVGDHTRGALMKS